MKVLLSWLRDFAPDRRARRPHRPRPVDARHGRRGGGATSARGLDGIVVARVLELRQHPDAKKIQRVTVDAGGARPRRGLVRRLQHGRRRPRARSPRSARRCPTAWRSAGARSSASTPTGCCARPPSSSSPTTAAASWSSPDGAPSRARRSREALGIDARRPLGPRDQPQPARRHVGRRRRPRPRRPLRACRSRCPSPSVAVEAASRRRRRPRVEILDPDLCGRFTAAVLRGVSIGPVARVDRPPAHAARHAPDQQRRRRVELRDARARPAQPPLRPGHAARRRHPGPAGPRRRDPRHPRRRRAPVHAPTTCSSATATTRAIGIAGIMGGADDRDQRHDHRRARRDGVVRSRCRSPRRRGGSACAARRRPASRRAPTPRSSTWPPARFAELLGAGDRWPRAPSTRAATCPTRRPVRLRTARVNRLLGTALAPERGPGRARADRLRLHARSTATTTSRSRRGGPTARSRSTSSRRSPATAATTASARPVPPAAHFGAPDAERQQRPAPGARAPWSASGSSEAMPMAFLAPGDQARAGLGDDGITITNPLVAEESVLRTSLLPGLLKVGRLQPRRTARPTSRLFEIGHVFRRPADPATTLPDEREHLGRRRRRGGGARRRRARGGRWPSTSAVDADARGRRRRPACTRPASAEVVVDGEVDRRRRRGRPRRARRLRHRRAGRLARGRPRPAPRPAARRAAVRAVQPLPVERRRPRLRGARRRAGRRRASPPSRARARTCSSSRRACSTSTGAPGVADGAPQPGLPAAVPGRRPHPHRRRGRRGPEPRSSPPSSRPCPRSCVADADAAGTAPSRRRRRAARSATRCPRGPSPSAPALLRRRARVVRLPRPRGPATRRRASTPRSACCGRSCSSSDPASSCPVEQEVSRALADRRARGDGGGPLCARRAILAAGLLGLVLLAVTASLSPLAARAALRRPGAARSSAFALAIVRRRRGPPRPRHVQRPRPVPAVRRLPRRRRRRSGSRSVRSLVAAGVDDRRVAYGLAVGVAPLVRGRRRHGPPARPRQRRSRRRAGASCPSALAALLVGSVLSFTLVNAGTARRRAASAPSAEETEAGRFQATACSIARVPLFLFQAVQAALLPKLSALAGAGRLDELPGGHAPAPRPDRRHRRRRRPSAAFTIGPPVVRAPVRRRVRPRPPHPRPARPRRAPCYMLAIGARAGRHRPARPPTGGRRRGRSASPPSSSAWPSSPTTCSSGSSSASWPAPPPSRRCLAVALARRLVAGARPEAGSVIEALHDLPLEP